MFRNLIIIVTTLMLVGTAGADQQADLNGAFWERMSQSQRIFYVRGILEGMSYGRWDVRYDLIEEAKIHPPNGVTSKVMEDWAISVSAKNYQKTKVDKILTSQVISGITKMYADYRNQQIPIISLVDVVTDSIKGTSKEEVEERLIEMRKQIANGSVE